MINPGLDLPATTLPESLSSTADHLDRVIQEYELQVAVSEAQRAKTVYAMRQIALLHRTGALSKRDTFQILVLLDATVEFPEPYATIWAEAMREQVLMYVDHMHKAMRLGAKNLAIEIDRSLYPPPQQPGLFERLYRGLLGDRR